MKKKLISHIRSFNVTQGHWNRHGSSAIYDILLVFYSNFVPKIFDFKNDVTLKYGLGVHERHWTCHHSIERI